MSEYVTTMDALAGIPADAPNHDHPRTPESTREKIATTHPGESVYKAGSMKRRLYPDRPSYTIISGGTRPSWTLAHPTEDRGLTVRERARLQTFDDDYVFHGGKLSGRVQTGNAVPPLLAETLFQAFNL